MTLPRLRQAVLVTRDLDPTLTRLREALGRWIDVPEPFRDPGVGQFGLENAVIPVGDSFLEILAPVQPDTAAGRHLDRRGGDAGYMVMFQVADMAATRARLADLAVRVVWQIELPGAVDLHLHPRDVPGALVAVDTMDPPGSWRWGGPEFTGPEVTTPSAGGLVGLTVGVPDPVAAARRWAAVLGRPEPDGTAVILADGCQRIDFTATPGGLTRIAFALPGASGEEITIGDTTIEIDRWNGERA